MVLEVWDGKPTYRKSWAGILLVWSDLTFGPLLPGQMRTAKLKSAYNSWAGNVFVWLDLTLAYWDGRPTYRKSWAGILLVWSDLTFGPLLPGQMRTAKLKSAYNSLIIGPRGLGW